MPYTLRYLMPSALLSFVPANVITHNANYGNIFRAVDTGSPGNNIHPLSTPHVVLFSLFCSQLPLLSLLFVVMLHSVSESSLLCFLLDRYCVSGPVPPSSGFRGSIWRSINVKDFHRYYCCNHCL
jgi:hypothetical protein